LGDVVGHDGVPDEAALRVADGGDEPLRPEPASVLADAPALLDRATLGRGPLERPTRSALPGFLGGVEQLHVLADDLVRRVSFEPLGSGVPTLHPARSIEHVEGIVSHAVHPQAEPPPPRPPLPPPPPPRPPPP